MELKTSMYTYISWNDLMFQNLLHNSNFICVKNCLAGNLGNNWISVSNKNDMHWLIISLSLVQQIYLTVFIISFFETESLRRLAMCYSDSLFLRGRKWRRDPGRSMRGVLWKDGSKMPLLFASKTLLRTENIFLQW